MHAGGGLTCEDLEYGVGGRPHAVEVGAALERPQRVGLRREAPQPAELLKAQHREHEHEQRQKKDEVAKRVEALCKQNA